jgi:hypothetical protein
MTVESLAVEIERRGKMVPTARVASKGRAVGMLRGLSLLDRP